MTYHNFSEFKRAPINKRLPYLELLNKKRNFCAVSEKVSLRLEELFITRDKYDASHLKSHLYLTAMQDKLP